MCLQTVQISECGLVFDRGGFFYIIIYKYLVVEQVHALDKRVDDPATEILVERVAGFEGAEILLDLGGGHGAVELQAQAGDVRLHDLQLGGKLVRTFIDAVYDQLIACTDQSVGQLVQLAVDLFLSVLGFAEAVIFLILLRQFFDPLRDLGDPDIRKDVGHGLPHDIPFQKVLPLGFFAAFAGYAVSGLAVTARVIGVDGAILTCAEIADHGGSTVAAVQLAGQSKIPLVCLFSTRGGIGGQQLLHLVVQITLDDDGCLHLDVAALAGADIDRIGQDRVKIGAGKRIPTARLVTVRIEPLGDLGLGFAIGILRVDLADGCCFAVVDHKTLILRVIAKGDRAAPDTLAGGLTDPAQGDSGQAAAVCLVHCLVHSLQDCAVWTVGDCLCGGDHAHTGGCKLPFVDDAVVAVAGESVKSIDNHKRKLLLFRVSDHA